MTEKVTNLSEFVEPHRTKIPAWFTLFTRGVRGMIFAQRPVSRAFLAHSVQYSRGAHAVRAPSTTLMASLAVLLSAATMPAQATVVTIPQSALIPSTTYYTDILGGGIGSVVVMTGGGNAPGIGDPSGRNDDGFSGPIPLGFTLNFFGTDYTTFFANNNGNISFTGGLAQFTPSGPQGAAVPVISPYFGDVDTRNLGSGVMHLRTDIPDQIIVTWDATGYFNAHADLLNSFQLVLRGPGYSIPSGEGAIGFWYRDMQWETGDASGGTGGFGGTPAAVGFGDGQSNGEVLQGSTENGIAQVVRNHHIWFDPNLQRICGVPGTSPCPVSEPSSLVVLLLGLAGLPIGRRALRKE